MKNKTNREKLERPTTEEVEAALHAALRDEGRLFPETDAEVAELEESLDLTGVPTPDANGFLARLRQRQQSKITEMPKQKQQVEAAVENLAMAARNGKSIPKSTRQKMDELRERYEQGKKKSDDGNS
jgi:hypothetical protein